MVGRKLPFPASDRAIHTRPSLHITLADNSFPWRHFLLPPRTADYWKHVKVRRMAIVLQNLDRLQESLGMLQEWLQCLRSTKKIPEGSVLNFVPSHMTSIKAWSLAGSSVVIVAKFSFLAHIDQVAIGKWTWSSIIKLLTQTWGAKSGGGWIKDPGQVNS